MYNLVHFLALSHKIFISCAYRPNRGECSQHQPHKCQVDGDTASWSGGASPFSGQPRARNLEPLRLPWTHRACHRPLGSVQPLLRRPGSAEQLQGAGHQQAHSVSDDVTEHERDEPWYFCKFVNMYFFDSIRLHFFWKYSFACFWKYSFAFFWKYSFAITWKVIACIFF